MKVLSSWAFALLIALAVPTTNAREVPSSDEYCDKFVSCVPSEETSARQKAGMRLKVKLSQKEIVSLSARSILDGVNIKETVSQISGGSTISDIDIIYREVLKDGKIEVCAFLKDSGC